MRGWLEDEEEEAERIQQQKQHRRRSQMQQQEAALEGAAGEPASGGSPLGGVQAAEALEEYEEWMGSWGGQAEEVAEAR